MMVNGVCVVQGEASAVVALLKKFRRNVLHLPALDDHDPLLRNFADLRDVLNSITDLSEMSSRTFLSPFLEVIKSEATDGIVTLRALAAVDKFINYSLICSNSIKMASAVQYVAEAVIKAKFVGTSDTASDECVLYQILQTLRSLLLFSGGRYLTDETVCEILQCCFRIGLESSLSELLRMAAESALADMTRLLFTRLPTFTQDIRHPYIQKLLMKAKENTEKKKMLHKDGSIENIDINKASIDSSTKITTTAKSTSLILNCAKGEIDDVVILDVENSSGCETDDGVYSKVKMPTSESDNNDLLETNQIEYDANIKKTLNLPTSSKHNNQTINSKKNIRDEEKKEKNLKGQLITKTKKINQTKDLTEFNILHGLPCVRELLRFLIALTNPQDKSNTDSMILIGLNLLTIALEAGADYFANYKLLLPLIKNEMCKSLLQLLHNEKLQIFTAVNRVCFLLFESLRTHLKLQLEFYFLKLSTIITNKENKIPCELKEIALESLVQLWRIPGLVTELFLNYDCDLYYSNLFEDLTRLLLQNAFPLGGLRSTHILSLDALLAVIETIEKNCVMRQADVLNSLTLEEFFNEDEVDKVKKNIATKEKSLNKKKNRGMLMALIFRF